MVSVSLTGFSWPAEAMGSCWSCLYRDPIRDNHLTKFKVNNPKITLNSLHISLDLSCIVFFFGLVITCITAPVGLFVSMCHYALLCYISCPCPRSPMWMTRAMSWALGSWSSPRPSSFFTHVRGTPSGGHISACDATATTPICFLLRAVAAVRLGRVSYIFLSLSVSVTQ